MSSAKSVFAHLALAGVLTASACDNSAQPTPRPEPRKGTLTGVAGSLGAGGAREDRLLAHVRDGYIDRSGSLVIKLNSRHHGTFSNGLARVWTAEGSKDNKERWGYVDATGGFAVPPTYDWALPFSDEVGVVNVGASVGSPTFVKNADAVWAKVEGGEWRVIDRRGKVLLTLKFDEVRPFKDGLAPVRTGAKWGYVDKTGKVVVPPRYDDADVLTDGMGAVRVGRKWGFIDKAGQQVIEPRYFSRIELMAGQVLLGIGYSEGLAWVTESGSRGSLWGVIDTSGKFVIQPTYEQFGRDFSGGVSAVGVKIRRNIVETHRVIDASGRTIAENSYEDVGQFHEGVAYFRSGKKHGAIDKSGKVLIEPMFDESFGFAEGLAAVVIGGKSGYIDKTGAWVIPAGDLVDAWEFQRVAAH